MEEKQKEKEKLSQKEKENKQKNLLQELLQMQNYQNNNQINTTHCLDARNSQNTKIFFQSNDNEMTKKNVLHQEELENISILNNQWENHRQHVRTALKNCILF